jgi:hypothetical protein
MADPNMPSYKMYVFMNTLVLTAEEREVIKTKLRKDNAVAVWIYGSGVVDPELPENRFSAEHISDLTGIKMTEIYDKLDAVFRWNGEEHPISDGFGKRNLYGEFDRRRLMMLPMGDYDPRSRWDTYLYPLFHSVDPEAKNLAYFLTTGYPAVSVKECDGYTSIFYGSKCIKSETVRAFAKFAGCHIYCDSDDVLYANNNFVTFHSSSDGKKKVKFNRPVSPFELYEEKYYGEKVTEIEFDTYLGETKMWRLD